MSKNTNAATIKIKIITDKISDYQKGQIIEVEEKLAINLLTNGKALRIHRKKDEMIEQKTEENSEDKTVEVEKEGKKSKKNDQ